MRGVVAASLAYFLRRGLGTNLCSTSSLEMIELLLRALLAENIFSLVCGFVESCVGVGVCVCALAHSIEELFTHISRNAWAS